MSTTHAADRRSVRFVTLVVNEPRGVLAPFVVATPWWQDVASLRAAATAEFGIEITVLRLLGTDGPFPGGDVTYLVEAPEVDPDLLAPTSIGLTADPNRAPYAEVGAPARLLEWAMGRLRDASIDVNGRPSQERMWNLAATWTIPTSSGRVWLKATPRFLDHEAAVLEHLRPTALVPDLIAGQPGRALMHHVAGVDGPGIGGRAMQDAVDVLLRIQAATDIGALPSVPRIDTAAFARQLDRVVARWGCALGPDDRSRLSGLRSEVADRFGVVASCGEALVHGDFHGGNVRLRPSDLPVLLDWGDSFVGSPLFDVFALERHEIDGADAIRRHWLERLGSSDEQWSAFRPVAAMLLPLVYQRFCDNVETVERAYHEPDILPALRISLRTV